MPIKYIILDKKEDGSTHYEYCEKNKYPFITVKQHGRDYAEIFYDVTNSSLCLSKISENVKNIYIAYIAFVHLPIPDVQNYLDPEYFFMFLVRLEDLDFIASRLFDYLMVEMTI